jgi:tRNA pseudouridine(38-40) synthase
MHVTNGIPLRCSLFLPVGTVNSVQTLKDITGGSDYFNSGLPAMQEVEIRVQANRFLYNQVRNMVAALVEVGRGARSVGWAAGLLIAKGREAAPRPAPPGGA